MSRTLWLSVLLSATSSVLRAQAHPASSIEGVWKVAEVSVSGANASTNTSPPPGYYIFTRKHYSVMVITGNGPRPQFERAKDPARLTDAEKLARFEQWNRFTANSGTYQLSGNALSLRPLVAKNDTVMTADPIVRNVKFEGKDLWLIQKGTATSGETRIKLTRVE